MKTLDKTVEWLESEQFKRWCIIFLAFAVGYFVRSIIQNIGG